MDKNIKAPTINFTELVRNIITQLLIILLI
jgi:hypothetical protein